MKYLEYNTQFIGMDMQDMKQLGNQLKTCYMHHKKFENTKRV